MTMFSGTGISFSLDLLIFIGFLALTLLVGLSTKRHIKTIQEYALGGKNFSTATLVATILATWLGGGTLFSTLEQTYSKGLYHILPLCGLSVNLLLMAWLVPYMRPFLNNVSVAEAMGDMYGRRPQLITACAGALANLGHVAIQFKAISKVLVLLFNWDQHWVILLTVGITIFYALWGGIKAVTLTDVLQFFTFGTVIPILALVIWYNLKTPDQLAGVLNNPVFDPQAVFIWQPQLLSSLGLFFYFAMPGLSPEMFQRVSMAKSVRQARHAFLYAAVLSLLIYLLLAWVAILLLADNATLDRTEVFSYMVHTYGYTGLKGIIGIGVIALAMSTADSCLHSASVMFANDIVKPLSGQRSGSTSVARSFTIIGGLVALLLSLYSNNLLDLMLLAGSFFMPIFTVPMLLSMSGFRSSTRAVLAGMLAGFITTILWSLLFCNADSIVPGMLANLIILLSTHYLLGEPGGWQQIDPDSPLGLERAVRREVWQKRKEAIKNFKLYAYLEQLLPHQEGFFSLLGLYAMAATYIGLYTIERVDIAAYEGIYTGIYQTVLWAITAFISYPVWPLKSKRFMTFFWPLGMAAILLFTGALLVILSHFHPLQLFVLLANFLLVALLLRWPMALVLAFSSISLAGLFFMQYTGEALRWEEMGSLQLRFLYGAFIFTGLLLAFFAYQEAFKRLGQRNEALQTREQDQQAHLVQVAAEKQAALTAFQHTGASELLNITKDLQRVPEEGKALLVSLQKRLLPIAFHLQGIDTRSQDYLRLKIDKLSLQSWCKEIKEEVAQKGVALNIYCRHDAKANEINGDEHQLTSLIVKSMVVLSTQAETAEDQPAILFRLEDTHLSYPLPDVKKGYIKQAPAVRLAITISDDLPVVKDSYSPNLNGFKHSETAEDPAQLANSRIVKSHYGYAEVTDDTLIYVIPVDVSEVRPRDMDKAYMEVDATPKRSDDHFIDKERGVDAQAQEVAFLADVAARSEANVDRVKMALETIKWYHGPSKRKSGEPFYLHPLTVAHIVLDYDQNEATIIGSLLHDTVEDTPMQLEHIEVMFGKETAEVVDVVTHLQSIPGSIYKVKLSASENLQMLDRTESIQGLYVKLADRMHNMRTIKGHSKVSKRKLIARETMDFFVPLAEKLGLQEAAQEFEKMCEEVFEMKV